MKRFLILALMWASAAFGQVFTTLYLPSAGGGLTLNIAAGRAFCGGSVITYAGGTLTMSASATNRVYLNTASSCVPAVKSTAFTNSDIPIATVTTSGSAITLVADARTMFNQMLTSSQVVSSINGSPGSFNFTGPGVSCTGTSCTFTGGSGSGVQYNPTTTSYVVTTMSGWYDDTRSKPIAAAVTSYSCVHTTTSTCTMNFASAHGLVVGGAIDPDQLTGWPYPNYQGAQFGSFQVTTVPTSTSLTFTTPTVLTATCASACGTAYDASYWIIWTFARQPYIYGHGTVWGIETTAQNLDTNFASLTAGMAGTPTFLINGTGVNDFAAGSTVSQVETWTENIWQHAQAQSPAWKVLQTTLIPAKFGIFGQGTKLGEFNIWTWAQSKTSTRTASGKYFDYYADPASAVAVGYGIGTAPEEDVAQYVASTLNNAIASQSSTAPFPPLAFTFSGSSNNNVPAEYVGAQRYFYDDSWNNFMAWLPGSQGMVLNSISNHKTLQQFQSGMSAGAIWCADAVGQEGSTNNSFIRCFKFVGAGSTDNYLDLAAFGASTANIRLFASGEVSFPGVATSPSTAPACFNGTHGGITNVGCSSGSGDVVGPASSTTDNIATYGDTTGKLIKDSGIQVSSLAPKASPAFSGIPTAPTAAPGTNTGQLASTAFVQAAVTAAGTAFAGGLGTSFQDVTEIAAPANPAAGNDRLYTDSGTHKLACRTSAGADCMPTSGGTASIGFNVVLNTGVAASPALPNQIAPVTGTITACKFLTQASDGSTALTFDIKLAGTSILSGSSATISAGTSSQTITTLTLTGSISVTSGQIWELDITSGTASWTGSLSCY